MNKPTTQHSLRRTSPKGGPFIGRCVLCGQENLQISAMNDLCPNPSGVSAGDALVEAIQESAAPTPPDHVNAAVKMVAPPEVVMELIGERDNAENWADKLANAIADRLGVDIGEHSNANNPWQEALDYCEAPAPAVDPLPMILHCPLCRTQHIDQPEEGWDNPPHRSHKCQSCGYIWRPADVATVGVPTIQTRGERDSKAPPAPEVEPAAWAAHDAQDGFIFINEFRDLVNEHINDAIADGNCNLPCRLVPLYAHPKTDGLIKAAEEICAWEGYTLLWPKIEKLRAELDKKSQKFGE